MTTIRTDHDGAGGLPEDPRSRTLPVTLTVAELAALGDDAYELVEYLSSVLVGLAELRTRGTGRYSSLDAIAWLRPRLEGLRAATVRALAANGSSHAEMGEMQGLTRQGGAHQRRALDAEPGGAEMWARGQYAPVDHPGINVPDRLRNWRRPWPGYLPVVITPPELRPGDGLAASVAAGWAEPAATPLDLDEEEWRERERTALIRFERDEKGWPMNPSGRTGRAGRNLGKWAENRTADPAIVTGDGPDRRILLIKRRDLLKETGRHVWALPGGHLEPGETAIAAAAREGGEETGVALALGDAQTVADTVVDDWRATDHAWPATTLVLFRLDTAVPPTPGDDAADAAWFPATDLDELTAAVEQTGGELYAAHRRLITLALGYLNSERGKPTAAEEVRRWLAVERRQATEHGGAPYLAAAGQVDHDADDDETEAP